MKVSIPTECCINTNGEEIVCSERGRRIKFFNPKKRAVIRYVVDGCSTLRSLLGEQSCKLCDFIVIDWRREEHYIELKGANVERALQQLESTIPKLRKSNTFTRLHCWIITSESPSAQSKFMVLKARFQKRFGARLTIRTNQHEHRFEE